jgi:phosphoserine phosphatase
MKILLLSFFIILGLTGCSANYQDLVDWKNDRVGTHYAVVQTCEIKDGAYVGTAKLCFGEHKGKVVNFYLKPYFKPTVPYSKDTVLFIEDK